jgi:hypothetical protein
MRFASCFGVLVFCFALVVGVSELAVADNPPDRTNRELHVVGIYEGSTRTGNEIHGGRATVTIDRPSRRVTLILNSY